MNNSFIFNPLNKSNNNYKEIENQFFTLVGSHDFTDKQDFPRINDENDERILAKKIIRKDSSIKYLIKSNSNGKLKNPLSIYGPQNDTHFLDHTCRSNDRFKEVSFKVFDLYLNFLKTKNLAWLNNAEREAE